jgi:hypothetical protein
MLKIDKKLLKMDDLIVWELFNLFSNSVILSTVKNLMRLLIDLQSSSISSEMYTATFYVSYDISKVIYRLIW